MDLDIAYSPKPIKCILSEPETHTKLKPDDKNKGNILALIFTHGAGGTITSNAITNFSSGFSTLSSVLCFQGNMNLKSRIKMFGAVIGDQKFFTCLGGRSLGARAAVMAATKDTVQLVLISYPLQTTKELRDQILLDLPSRIEVIFVSGEADSMCDLEKLEQIRSKMDCKTWRIVVQDADHGMNVKPKLATQEVGKMVGEIVARWVTSHNDRREGRVFWNCKEKRAEWSGWAFVPPPKEQTLATSIKASSKSRNKRQVRHQSSEDVRPISSTESATTGTDPVSMRTRKRRKI